MNNIFFIVISLLVILYITYSIRKNRLDATSSFAWILFCIILLFLSIWPTSIDWFANILGITYPPALFLTITIIILFIMIFVQSKKIEDLHKKVIDLAQELSILKNDNISSINNKKSNPPKKQ